MFNPLINQYELYSSVERNDGNLFDSSRPSITSQAFSFDLASNRAHCSSDPTVLAIVFTSTSD